MLLCSKEFLRPICNTIKDRIFSAKKHVTFTLARPPENLCTVEKRNKLLNTYLPSLEYVEITDVESQLKAALVPSLKCYK